MGQHWFWLKLTFRQNSRRSSSCRCVRCSCTVQFRFGTLMSDNARLNSTLYTNINATAGRLPLMFFVFFFFGFLFSPTLCVLYTWTYIICAEYQCRPTSELIHCLHRCEGTKKGGGPLVWSGQSHWFMLQEKSKLFFWGRKGRWWWDPTKKNISVHVVTRLPDHRSLSTWIRQKYMRVAK